MNKWQPIETIPKDGSVVVMYCPHHKKHKIICGYFYSYAPGADMFLDRSGRPINNPTHWMKPEEPNE